MSFPPAFLDELRSRLPLSELVGKRLRLIRAGREFKGCCPFHNEKTPSFYVNDDKQFFHCFGCGAHGDVIGFTMRHDRLSFPEAIETLAGQAGLPVPRDTPVEREKFDQEKRLHQLLERATVFFEEQLFTPAGREALDYFRKRGLSDDGIRRFRLGYAPQDGQQLIRKLVGEGYKPEELASVGLTRKNEDRNETYSFFRHRAMFPVGDRRGRIVAFGGRVLGEGEPKYLNSPDHPLFHKGQLLYGLSRARAAVGQNQPLIVVEGYMDVIALVEAGWTGAVAPLGTALTEDQLAALWKLLPPATTRDPARDYCPIVCFDGDSAGLRAAARAVDRALPLLTPEQSLRVAVLPEGQDPDDLLRKEGRPAVELVLKQARPMIDVVWDMALANRSLRTPEERGAFITVVKQKASVIAHTGLKSLYLEEIQRRINELMHSASSANLTATAAPRHTKPFKRIAGSRWQPPAPEPVLTRRQPLNPVRARERSLLALILNYPPLFGDFGEDFVQLEFQTPEFGLLRERLVEILSLDSHEPLDATELYRHLSHTDQSGKPVPAHLDEILSEATYLHAGFARPDGSLDKARQGWISIWNKHLKDQLEAELKQAGRQYAAENSEVSLNRLLAVRSQLEALSKEINDAEMLHSA